MTQISERSQALADFFAAFNELERTLNDLLTPANLMTPGVTLRLVDRARQELQVILSTAEYLSSPLNDSSKQRERLALRRIEAEAAGQHKDLEIYDAILALPDRWIAETPCPPGMSAYDYHKAIHTHITAEKDRLITLRQSAFEKSDHHMVDICNDVISTLPSLPSLP